MQNNASLRHTAAARCETRRSSCFGSNSGPHAPAWIFRRNINQVTALLVRPTRKHWMREESSARYTRVMKLLPLLVECYSPISCSASAMFQNTRKTRVRKFARSGIAGTRPAAALLADCSFACIRAGIPAAGGAPQRAGPERFAALAPALADRIGSRHRRIRQQPPDYDFSRPDGAAPMLAHGRGASRLLPRDRVVSRRDSRFKALN